MRKPVNEIKRLWAQLVLMIGVLFYLVFVTPRDFNVFVSKIGYIAIFFLLVHLFRTWQFPYIKYGDLLHDSWESAKGNPLAMAIIFLAISFLLGCLYLAVVIGGSLGA